MNPTRPIANGPDYLLLPLHELTAETVIWLWPGRLAEGKLAILDGDPGLGKSLVTLDLCARLTRGRPFPDDQPSGPPRSVILLNCEDGLRDTILPRLHNLGADLQRVRAFQGRLIEERAELPQFPRDFAVLERAIQETRAALVVIDPIMAYLGAEIMTSNDQSVRQALTPLAVIADQTRCTILLVRHLNKSGGARAVYRGGGSIGIIGACRSAWLIGRHPQEPRHRVLAQIKNNLAPPQPSLAFEIVGDESGFKQVSWLGKVELEADQLLAAAAPPDDRERASAFLQETLAGGPKPVADLVDAARRQGVSRATLYRARKELGLTAATVKVDGKRQAAWKLPKHDPADADLLDLEELPPLEELSDLLPPLGDDYGPYKERY